MEDTHFNIHDHLEKMREFFKHKKLTKKDTVLLAEAYRRIMTFQNMQVKGVWCGLGTTSEYRSIYFKPHNGKLPEKRINGWWVLTEDGQQIMEDLIKVAPFPKHPLWQSELNNALFI